jgi:methylmalonyl-CoA/ethylmalonyl-CoA epimerase
VRDTERALEFFRDRLGLTVTAVDLPPPPAPAVRLTYLDGGPIAIQLVEPLDGASAVAAWLGERGDGLHHLCFGTDDVAAEIRRLAGDAAFVMGSGQGRPAAFLPGGPQHGVAIEFTAPAPDERAADRARDGDHAR